MKDSMGSKLTVGDTVAYIESWTPSCHRLEKALIVGFTPKNVKIDIFNGIRPDPAVILCIPEKLVKISDGINSTI